MSTPNGPSDYGAGDEPIFVTDPGYANDPTYTPQAPGAPPAAPIAISPAPPSGPPVLSGPIAAAAPIPVARRAPTTLSVPVVAGVARYQASDYAGAARKLLPRGRAWSDDPAGVLAQMLLGVGKVFERSDAALQSVLAGTLPGNLAATLPEWEATLGLPDPCAGDTPTFAQRLSSVRGRFVGAGGQSRRHFIDFAAALGFAIEISVYKPGQANLPAGTGLDANSLGWMFVWGVRVTASSGDFGADVLMCELNAVKPAETTVILLA